MKSFKPKKITLFSLAAFLTYLFLVVDFAMAWSGYDFDDKFAVEIDQGNLVREGLIIQFYDYKTDEYHTAKIIFMEEVADGMRIQVQDLDMKKERIFIMQN